MPSPSTEGSTRVSKNGYHYTRTAEGWQLTHRLIMEEHIGRKLAVNERVIFVDTDRTNLSLDNLELQVTRTRVDRIRELRQRVQWLEAEIEQLEAQP